MDNIKGFVVKILATWVGIGVALMAIGSAGVDIPDSWLQLFSQSTADLIQNTVSILINAVGAVITSAQIIRAYFIKEELAPVEGEVSASAVSSVKALRWNPFKTLK